jgi:MoxR-like ATPase
MYCGENDIMSAGRVLQLFPGQAIKYTVDRIYPEVALYPLSKSEVLGVVQGLKSDATTVTTEVSFEGGGRPIFVCTDAQRAGESQLDLVFNLVSSAVSIEHGESLAQVTVRAPCGSSSIINLPSPGGTIQTEHFHLLSLMLQSHAAGRDMCLVGKAGSGKSFMSRIFARALGYAPVQTLFIYQDMTARDLLQRRSTDEFGATTWIPTPLTVAMQEGRLAVLDGVHRLPVGTISALLRLLDEREITLFDGTSYVCPARYTEMQERLGYTDTELAARGIYRVHPSFCVLALANPPTRQDPWLNNEVLHLFHFFTVKMDLSSTLGQSHNADLLQAIVPGVPRGFADSISTFAMHMERLVEDSLSSVTTPVSLRQMLRMARRAAQYPGEVHSSLYNACMMMYMPRAEKEAVIALMDTVGIVRNDEEYSVSALPLIVTDADGNETSDYSQGATLQIGDITVECATPENAALVPNVVFYHIPMHTRLLRSMLQDFLLGEHLLLIGNQGVGKNKLTDRLLQLLRREREYIQLHRDTTVPALTLTPTLIDGKIVWEDSPLVKALIHGRVLMVDEADKAPTEVVCVMKGLLEDGEILLGDGRRFISSKSQIYAGFTDDQLPGSVHRIHDDFRVIALANRPGYPFLGNDFFAEMGDVFAVYAIDNPDQQSEIEMLQSYSNGAVPVSTLYKLTSAFKDLRQMTDDGVLSYPYSTRELVAIVQHMSMFRDETITETLENVFAFDSFDSELRRNLFEIFLRHDLPLDDNNGGGIRNSLALTTELGTPVEASIITRTGSESVPVQESTVPLVADTTNRFTAEMQIETMNNIVSARLNRFSEEVHGYALKHKPCVNGAVSLEDGSLAVLTQAWDVEIADLNNAVLKTVSLRGANAAHNPCDRSLVAAKSLNKLLTYDVALEVLWVIDPTDGSALPLTCPLLGSRGDSVRFIDAFEMCNCCILYTVGGSVMSFVHFDGAANVWRCTQLSLLSIQVEQVEILFSQKFLVRDLSGTVWDLTLDGQPGVFPPGTATVQQLMEEKRDIAVVGTKAGRPGATRDEYTAAKVKPGANTDVRIQRGVFAGLNGRFGEVIRIDGDGDVFLKWLDDGSESDFIEPGKLFPVVASRDDLMEDYRRLDVSGSQVKAGAQVRQPDDYLLLSKPHTAPTTLREVGGTNGVHHLVCAPDMYAGFTVGFKDVGQKEVGFTSTATVGSRWCYPRDNSELDLPASQRIYVACGLTATPTTVMAVSDKSSLTIEVVNLDLGIFQQIKLGSQIGEAPVAKDDGVTATEGLFSPVCGIAEMADQTIALVQANGTVRIVDIDQDSLREAEELWQSELR